MTRPVTSGDYIRPYRKPRVRTFKEGATQTFLKGAPLIFSVTADHENEVVEAGADPAYIIGYAAQDASGVQGTAISVYLATADSEFRAVVQNTGTLDYTNIGTRYGLVYDAGNKIWRVDLTEVTVTHCTIVDLLDKDGDVNGYVVFKPVMFTTTDGITQRDKPYGVA